MKKTFIPIVFLFVLFACDSEKKESDIEFLPNIVLIIGDDQGYPYFGFMGADYVHTPNMDALAASGTLFTEGYVPANHCRPSLQSLMTGTLPIDYDRTVDSLLSLETSRIRFDSAEAKALFEREFRHHAMKHFKTLPKFLAEKDYRSFQSGKWWEFNYKNGGFEEGMTTGWNAEQRKNGGKWFKQFMGGDGLKLARATMEPVYDFIEKNNTNPFFIWYAPELPHYPFDAPKQYYDLYKNEDMTESAKRYYANCTWFDDGVGELQQFLKEKGEFENTLFIYVNDNGWEQNPDQEFRNDSLRWHNGGDKGKLSMYDQSFRTPIIFSWNGKIEPGVRKSDLIHSTDISATILDFLNIKTPDDFFGKSFKSVIENDASGLREEIIGKIDQTRSEEDMMGKKLEGYWMRKGDWFFNWDYKNDVFSLYDLKNDPQNNENLAAKHPALIDEFVEKIKAWRRGKGLVN